MIPPPPPIQYTWTITSNIYFYLPFSETVPPEQIEELYAAELHT